MIIGPVESLANFEQTGVTLIAPAWSTATPRLATQLLFADHRQDRAQSFVVGNRPLVDLAELVKGAVGEIDAAVSDRQPAVG